MLPKIKLSQKLSDNRYNVINFLSNFENKMTKQGVKVFFVPPPYKQTILKQNQKYIKYITTELEKKGIGYITPPSRYAFPDSLFFDTSYHLNKIGVDKRTKYLIKDISKYIN